MMTKPERNNDDVEAYTDVEFARFCDSLEAQYPQAKDDSLFEVLKVLELDKTHSDNALVEAVAYFKEKNGQVEADAPMDFLNEREKASVGQASDFRPGLYCMLLSQKFSQGIDNKSVFLQHSYKFAFDPEA